MRVTTLVMTDHNELDSRVPNGGPDAEKHRRLCGLEKYVQEPVVATMRCARLHLPSPSPSLPLALRQSILRSWLSCFHSLVACPLLLVFYLLK